jgi:hypothetical protein
LKDAAIEAEFQTEVDARRTKTKVLLQQLIKTPDVRDDKCLQDLEGIYFDFIVDYHQGRVSVSDKIAQHITDLFDACIQSLHNSQVMWSQSQKLSDTLSRKAEKRKDILDKIRTNIDCLYDSINEIRISNVSTNEHAAATLLRKVETSLEVMRDIDRATRHEDETFNEYAKIADEQ